MRPKEMLKRPRNRHTNPKASLGQHVLAFVVALNEQSILVLVSVERFFVIRHGHLNGWFKTIAANMARLISCSGKCHQRLPSGNIPVNPDQPITVNMNDVDATNNTNHIIVFNASIVPRFYSSKGIASRSFLRCSG